MGGSRSAVRRCYSILPLPMAALTGVPTGGQDICSDGDNR
jgi:hypothetical protein